MRLLVDARYTRMERHDGISRYGASLIAAVAKHTDVVMLIHDERQLALLPDVPYVKINSPLSPLELLVARRINKLEPDVVFCPMQTMGSWGRKYGLILTLHDLIYYQNPQPPGFLPLPVRMLWRLYHKAYWPQRVLLNRADVVATISQTTKSLIEQYRLTRRPVQIVSNAPQPDQRPRDLQAAPKKTILYMGSFMPYKNVEMLIRGMTGLPDYTLHLLSPITPGRKAELEALVPSSGHVVFHNGVSDEEYQQLLRTTTALAILSRAEGYGLPIIEAMSVGTPVIASDIPIFREVGADAAVFLDPDRSEDLASAVRGMAEPARWRELAEAGLARAGEYNWDVSAKELLELACQVKRGES